jgi:2-succinyl-6-hydroxy-2,4-cyclohexadiene-1-carboxylate synthase
VGKVIHIFHGLFGSPQDFHFIQGDNITYHNLYSSWNIRSLNEDDILIGYSMGGRIALEIAHQYKYCMKSLVLLSAHPGLSHPEEIIQRKEYEEIILNKMSTLSVQEFLEWWNNLEIFKGDQPIIVDSKCLRESQVIFNRHRLSHQKDHLPELIKNRSKVLYVLGEKDSKYLEMAKEKFLPHQIKVRTINAGHRLYQHPEKLLHLLQEENIL